MPKFIAKLLLSLLSNILALLAAVYFVAGFSITDPRQNILVIAAVLTVLNAFLRPVIKLVFIPVILITFGLGIIIVNALILYLLDYLSPNLQITGLIPLFYATLIISAVNLAFHVITKKAN